MSEKKGPQFGKVFLVLRSIFGCQILAPFYGAPNPSNVSFSKLQALVWNPPCPCYIMLSVWWFEILVTLFLVASFARLAIKGYNTPCWAFE